MRRNDSIAGIEPHSFELVELGAETPADRYTREARKAHLR